MRDMWVEDFTCQQGSGHAHRPRDTDTARLLEQATSAFMPPDLWPPNSPDLNPDYYKIWYIVQQRVHQSRPAGAQHWWTEAAVAACLTWHWRDHHWQCNWRVAWVSSRTCGHFGQLLWQYSAVWQETFQFLSNVTQFLDFLNKLPQIRTYNFHKVVRQYIEGMVESINGFVGNLVLFSVVKEFWKSVKNRQSYRHEFDVLLFWDTVYARSINSK